MSTYRTNLNQWAADLQQLVYQLRDQLLIRDPKGVERFSLASQYQALFPEQSVPPQLSSIDDTLGVIVFSKDVQNDCGRFANLLLEHRKRDLVQQFIHDRGLGVSRKFPSSERQNFTGSAAVRSVKSAKLDYFNDDNFPYPHHAKTSLAEIGGDIFTLEAHKGKPFLLAPELRRYRTQDEFLESTDIHVKTRTETTLSGRLESELTPLSSSEKSDSERFEELRISGGGNDVTTAPIGRFAEQRKPSFLEHKMSDVEDVQPLTAIELLSEGRIEEFLLSCANLPGELLTRTMMKIKKELDGRELDRFSIAPIAGEFCTGISLNSYKFNQGKWDKWIQS
jgi:hypothetical protein